MRIKFLKDAKYIQNNADDSKEYKAGKEYDVGDDHGRRWVRRGLAVEVPAVPAKPTTPPAKKE